MYENGMGLYLQQNNENLMTGVIKMSPKLTKLKYL